MKVQDCLWQRMKPSQIARHLGKDKAWVSRAIRKLEDERATACHTPEESQLVRKNIAQLESLVATAMRIAGEQKDSRGRLAAIRTAAEVLRQRNEYQIAVGHVQRRDARNPIRPTKADTFLASLEEELPPEAALAALEKLVELRKQPKLFKPERG